MYRKSARNRHLPPPASGLETFRMSVRLTKINPMVKSVCQRVVLPPLFKDRGLIKWPYDFLITVGSPVKSCRIHKIVLAVMSPYFEARIKYEPTLQGGQVTQLHLNEVDHDTLQVLVQFAYTGQVKVSKKNVAEIRRAGDFYCIDGLVAACDKFLAKIEDEPLKVPVSYRFKALVGLD